MREEGYLDVHVGGHCGSLAQRRGFNRQPSTNATTLARRFPFPPREEGQGLGLARQLAQ
jgi:hypothetical protein